MANRTVKDAYTIKGTNPQYLIEKIIRTRIYDSQYWKEECFALTAELLVDKAMELRYIGGVYAGNIKPTPFLCLCLKMLQIQPERDIIIEFIRNEDFKYVRALGAFYLRLVGTSIDSYKYLEPLLNDYRKIRVQNREGVFVLSHMDEFIDTLLQSDRSCDVILPRIQKRRVLEESNDLAPRVSALDEDLNEDEEEGLDTSSEDEQPPPVVETHRLTNSSRKRHHHRRSRSRSRNRGPPAQRERRRSRSEDRSRRRRSRSHDRSRHEKHRKSERESKGKSHRKSYHRENIETASKKDGASMSVSESNRLRESLGLAPLR